MPDLCKYLHAFRACVWQTTSKSVLSEEIWQKNTIHSFISCLNCTFVDRWRTLLFTTGEKKEKNKERFFFSLSHTYTCTGRESKGGGIQIFPLPQSEKPYAKMWLTMMPTIPS